MLKVINPTNKLPAQSQKLKKHDRKTRTKIDTLEKGEKYFQI